MLRSNGGLIAQHVCLLDLNAKSGKKEGMNSVGRPRKGEGDRKRPSIEQRVSKCRNFASMDRNLGK